MILFCRLTANFILKYFPEFQVCLSKVKIIFQDSFLHSCHFAFPSYTHNYLRISAILFFLLGLSSSGDQLFKLECHILALHPCQVPLQLLFHTSSVALLFASCSVLPARSASLLPVPSPVHTEILLLLVALML